MLTNAKNKEFIFVDKQAEIKIKLYENILFFRIGNFCGDNNNNESRFNCL